MRILFSMIIFSALALADISVLDWQYWMVMVGVICLILVGEV